MLGADGKYEFWNVAYDTAIVIAHLGNFMPWHIFFVTRAIVWRSSSPEGESGYLQHFYDTRPQHLCLRSMKPPVQCVRDSSSTVPF